MTTFLLSLVFAFVWVAITGSATLHNLIFGFALSTLSLWIVRGEVDPRKAERAVFLAESKYCAVAATLRGAVALSHHIRVEPGV